MQRLIGHGAVDIVVPGMLPIGCFPLYLTLYGSSNKNDYTDIGCLRKYNDFAEHHNSFLQRVIYGLQRKYSWTRIRYADYYSPTLRFASNPTKYGESSFMWCWLHDISSRQRSKDIEWSRRLCQLQVGEASLLHAKVTPTTAAFLFSSPSSPSKVEPTHFIFTKFNYYMIIFLGKKTLIIMHVKQIPMMPIARVLAGRGHHE